MHVQAQSGLVDVFVVVATGGVAVTVAGQTLVTVPRGARCPLSLVVHGAASLAIRAAGVVAAFALRMLKNLSHSFKKKLKYL